MPEIEYAVAVQLAHFVRHDMIAIALIEGGIIILFSALAVLIADRIPFRRDDDPLSRLAIVGALLALLYVAAVPVRNAALRGYDFGADRYAVALTGDPADAVRSLVRAADQRMEEACPEPAARLFFYTLARHRRCGSRRSTGFRLRARSAPAVDVTHRRFEPLVEPEQRAVRCRVDDLAAALGARSR